MKLSNKSLVILLITLSVILGGGISPAAKMGLTQLSPEVFTFLRFAIATIVIFPLFFKQKTGIRRELLRVAPLSLLLTANVLLFAYGVRLTTANIGQMLYVLTPIIVLLLSHFLLNDKITNRKLLGIIVGFGGALIVFILPIIEGDKFSGNIIGNVLVISAILCFSLYTVFSKRYQKKYTPIELTIVTTATTTVAMFLLSLPQLPNLLNNAHNISAQTVFAVLYIGIVGAAVSYGIYQYVIKLSSPTVAATTLYLQPLSTVVWSYFLLGEKLTLGFVIGGMFAILGTIIVVRSR